MLIDKYLRNNPPPILDDYDDMPELKARLPGNFSGRQEGANLWLLAMKAYFAMNPTFYNEKNKILVEIKEEGNHLLKDGL